MANNNFTVSVIATDVLDLTNPTPDRRGVVTRLARFLNGLNEGALRAVSLTYTTNQQFASNFLTLASASGTISCIINGVTISVTASGGDVATAAALAAAVNASGNSLVTSAVMAVGNPDGSMTLTSKIPGVGGNWVTLTSSGTGVTQGFAARLQNGAADAAVTVNF